MSVLIKGMKMPESCLNCPLETDYGTCGHFNVADYAKHPTVYSSRPVWCPLIELPPHGDLISRKWLVDIGLHLMNTAKNDDIANGVKWLWQYVIEAPTILEAEGGE